MRKKVIRQCLEHARKTLHSHPEYKHYPHWTFIIQDEKIVEIGMNNSGNPPGKFAGYSRRLQWGPAKNHSELNAYRRAKGLLNHQKPWEAVNIRLNRNGELRDSKPCVCCNGFIRANGCKRVTFSTDIGFARAII
jgi:tRNA(Arg) A34 adenosine deaminase TadA